MFAKVVSILCLASVVTALPQIIQSPYGIGSLGGISGLGLGLGGVSVGGIHPGIHGIGGLGGLSGIGGLGGISHSTVGYAPRYAPSSVAYASPAISSLGYPSTLGYPSALGYPSIGIPKIAVAAPPILHKTIISPPIIKTISPIDPNPSYSYNYGVNDPHTGDNKQAEETLVNGVVHGSYSLAEPDGTIRKVTYTADKINGFNAVVERHGVSHHSAPIHKVIAPAVHAPAILSPAYATGYPAYH